MRLNHPLLALLGITLTLTTIGIGYFLPDSASSQSYTPNAQISHFTTHHDSIPNFAQFPTVTAVASGSWTSPSTWSTGAVPGANAIVFIGNNHTVTYDTQSGDVDTIGIREGGTLIFSTTQNTRLKAANILVTEGGTLEVGTTANPVQPTVTAEIIIKDKPLDTTNDGAGVYDPFQFGTGLVAFDGTVTMHGSTKSPTFVRLASEPLAGHTQLTLSEAPSGWQPGDKIILPDTRHLKWNESHNNYIPQWEERTIQSISGSTITLNTPLTYDHKGARDGDGVLEFLPHVGNLTRNILIRSDNPLGTRGQVLFTNRSVIDIRYAELTQLGRTKNDPLDNTTADTSGNITKVGTNQIGRYALHAHHLFGPTTIPPNGYQFTFLGNSVHQGSNLHSFKWGIAVHDSHYGLIKDNVVYNTMGAGITTEDGSETANVIERNFVVRIDGSGSRGDSRGTTDLAHDGVGFWFRGVNNYIRNNVAANAYGNGADGHYGYKYYPYFLGNVKTPNYQGASTNMAGQYTTRDGNAMPILQFENNEVYSSQSGMTYWWVGAYGQEPRVTTDSIIKNFRVWHIYNKGIFHYNAARLILDGFTVRAGQIPNESACCSTGWGGNDYLAYNTVIRNADIQGMGTGIIPSTDTGAYLPSETAPGTQVIENSILRNYTNIFVETLWTSSYRSDILAPRNVTIRNVQFVQPTPYSSLPYSAIKMNYRADPVRTLIEKDDVFVYDYNGTPGDNFRVFYKEQAPNFIVPQTILNSDSTPRLEASPVSGLTNQQNWDQYGIAIAGSVASCTDDTTHPEIYGFTCPISSGGGDTTPPTISLTTPSNGSTVSNTITVAANASDNVGVTGVQFLLDGTNLGGEDTTSPYSISWNTTQTSNGSHTLSARARDAEGNTKTSTAITVTVNNTTADTTPPSPPTNLSATPLSSSQVSLSWSASTDNVGVTNYLLERCQGTSCTTFTQIATPTGASYQDTGLQANTTYRYRVKALDAANNQSNYSSIVTATTLSGGTTPPPTSGLIGHWTFDNNTLDSSGQNNHGTAGGGPVFTTGKIGQAMSFDGVDDYVNFGSIINRNFGFGYTGSVTASAWIYPTSLSAFTAVFDANHRGSVNLFIDDGVGNYYSLGGSQGSYTPSIAWTLNEWQHVVILSDGSTGRIYRNGVLTASGLSVGTGYTSATWGVGSNLSGGGNDFPGRIDDVRIYNRALSSAEIQSLYQSGLSGGSTLVGDLNSDGTVNSLDWSIMNAAWFTSDVTSDLNDDGLVNSLDFGLMNSNWGLSS